MCIGAININGLSKQLNWLEWEIAIQTMSKLQIDMFGLTEPNVNFNNKRTLANLRDIAKKIQTYKRPVLLQDQSILSMD